MNTLQPIRPMPAAITGQTVRPPSVTIPNGILGRIQKASQQSAGDTADGTINASRQSVAKLLNMDKKSTTPQSTPASFGILLAPLPFGA